MSVTEAITKSTPALPPIRGWWCWLATLISGALISLTLPPVDAGPLVLIAFVPWLLALRGFRTGFGAAAASFLGGLVAHALPFAFLNNMVGYAGTESAMLGLWIASMAICATTFVFVGLSARWLMQRTTRRWWALFVPLLWMGAEDLRYHFPVASPLQLPGYALHQIPALIQIAEIGSVHLVSGFVLLIASTITIAIDAKLLKDRSAKLFAPITLTAAFVVVLGFGMLRMSQLNDEIQVRGGPRVAVIQPGIPQEVKNTTNHLERWDIHRDMSLEAAKDRPDLIIWSETAHPFTVRANGFLREEGDSGSEAEPSRLAQKLDTALLIGAVAKPSASDLKRPEYAHLGAAELKRATYNSVLLYDRDGTFSGRHDKAHLVPGGEEIPYRDNIVGEMVSTYAEGLLEGFETSLLAGYRREIFHLKDQRDNQWRFSAKVCYEFAFPELACEIHNNPALPEEERNVHFVTTLSNEGWYQGGAELDQALIYSKFRAIESRTTIVRATNDGISAVIGPMGFVRETLEVDGQDRQVAGILNAELPYLAKPELTLYLKIGNAPYRLMRWALLLLLLWMPINALCCKIKRRREARGGVDKVTRSHQAVPDPCSDQSPDQNEEAKA